MADSTERTHEERVGAAQDLVVDGLPSCTIQAMADGTWHVVAQLEPEEQAALAAAATYPDTLCQRAQHALGLAGIGSRIALDRTAIGVYVPTLPMPSGVTPLVLDGRALLCWVARAPSEAIRTLIASAIEIIRATSTPSSS